MSRLTVACVTANPRRRSSSASSSWLVTCWRATSSRMARCRSRLPGTGRSRLTTSGNGGGAGRETRPEMRVVQRAPEGMRRRRVRDDRLRVAPGQGGERGADLRDHPAGDDAPLDQVLCFLDREAVEFLAVLIA